jgi:type III secretion protein U
MADKNDGGDKTEKPTPKRLQDARRKGNVAKSRDLTSTVELVVWIALFGLAASHAGHELMRLVDASVQGIGEPFANRAPALAQQAGQVLLSLTALALLPVAAAGVIAEFLQAGPVFALDKVKPKLENLDPAEGVKRMFSMDNLVEVAKSIAKTALLTAITVWVLAAVLPQLGVLIGLPTHAGHTGAAGAVAAGLGEVTRSALLWTVGAFVLVSLLDAAWQRHSFTKKMRMSLRDMREELKESEGNPMVKQQRQQAQLEWSQRNAQQAARQANVLVVNPTHVAIAIEYHRETCPVPTVSAKGEDHVARAMREAAEDAGVPVLRNVELARDLLVRGEIGEIVPADLFDIVAEVILWAREVHELVTAPAPGRPRHVPPGEDLTAYRAGAA